MENAKDGGFLRNLIWKRGSNFDRNDNNIQNSHYLDSYLYRLKKPSNKRKNLVHVILNFFEIFPEYLKI